MSNWNTVTYLCQIVLMSLSGVWYLPKSYFCLLVNSLFHLLSVIPFHRLFSKLLFLNADTHNLGPCEISQAVWWVWCSSVSFSQRLTWLFIWLEEMSVGQPACWYFSTSPNDITGDVLYLHEHTAPVWWVGGLCSTPGLSVAEIHWHES